jgi:hypothetical protein
MGRVADEGAADAGNPRHLDLSDRVGEHEIVDLHISENVLDFVGKTGACRQQLVASVGLFTEGLRSRVECRAAHG